MNYVSPGVLFVHNDNAGDSGGVEGGGGRGRYCHASCCHHHLDVQRYVWLPWFYSRIIKDGVALPQKAT